MNIKEIIYSAESPMFELRRCYEHANYIMEDILEDYFHMRVNPDDPKQHWMLAYKFKHNAVRAEIVFDALHEMQDKIYSLEQLFNKLAEGQEI